MSSLRINAGGQVSILEIGSLNPAVALQITQAVTAAQASATAAALSAQQAANSGGGSDPASSDTLELDFDPVLWFDDQIA